jgi:hypothetical protein
LTFSPSWGKRATAAQPQVLFGDSANTIPQSSPVQACNPKMESMLLIYRMIQNEAQKLLECNSQQKWTAVRREQRHLKWIPWAIIPSLCFNHLLFFECKKLKWKNLHAPKLVEHLKRVKENYALY